MTVRIVCLSDTHGRTDGWDVPEGDLLLHAGDLTGKGSRNEVRRALDWLRSLPHPEKVFIAGNHDFLFEREPEAARAMIHGLHYLQDESVYVHGLHVYGSPWQPRFFDWAFNLDRGEPLRERWRKIPEGVDVLLTHGPPRGHGDRTSRGTQVGCEDLLERIREVKPLLCVFGHIHEGYGLTREGETLCANASILSLHYVPENAPIVIDLDLESRRVEVV